jgi:hypothetical protein
MSYTLTQAEFKRLKTRLTFRKNRLSKVAEPVRDIPSLPKAQREKITHEANQLISEVDYAMKIFQEKGHPYDWARWERAKDDAQSLIQRAKPSW